MTATDSDCGWWLPSISCPCPFRGEILGFAGDLLSLTLAFPPLPAYSGLPFPALQAPRLLFLLCLWKWTRSPRNDKQNYSLSSLSQEYCLLKKCGSCYSSEYKLSILTVS